MTAKPDRLAPVPDTPDLSWRSATHQLAVVTARNTRIGAGGLWARWRSDPAGHAVTALLTVLVLAVMVMAQSAGAQADTTPQDAAATRLFGAVATQDAAGIDTTEPPPGEATAMPVRPRTGELPGWLPATVTRWEPNIVAASKRHGIPPALQGIVVLVESCGLASAGSSAGAQGLGQVVARYHPRILEGAGPFDPDHNLDVSAEYLAALWAKYGGDVDKVAASYNGGNPGNINAETNRYRRWVAGMWRDRDAADGGPMFAEWMAAVQATPGNLCDRAEAS